MAKNFSQRYKDGNGKFITFKDYLKQLPTKPETLKDALNYNSLTTTEKRILNGYIGGKKRSENSIKIKGKYINKAFNQKLKSFAKNNNTTLKDYFNTNREAIENFYLNDEFSFSYQGNKIYDILKKFKGDIIIDGVKTEQNEAILKIQEAIKEAYKKNKNVAQIITYVNYSKGATEINISTETDSDLDNEKGIKTIISEK
jgi:hypothetical protein